MKFVYIASRVSGEVERNLALANAYCMFAITKDVIPVVPHLMLCGVLDDNDAVEREIGINIGKALLERCDEVWVFLDKRGISSGMQGEILRALELLSILFIRFKLWCICFSFRIPEDRRW